MTDRSFSCDSSDGFGGTSDAVCECGALTPTWYGSKQPGWTGVCMSSLNAKPSCTGSAMTSQNFAHEGPADNPDTFVLKAGSPWTMNGFRYNDINWVVHERVKNFRIQYADKAGFDSNTWTTAFTVAGLAAIDANYKQPNNDIVVSFAPITASYWRWVLDKHHWATVRSIAWRGHPG